VTGADTAPPTVVVGRGHWRLLWQRLKRNRTAMVGGIFFALILCAALAGIWMAADSCNLQTRDARLGPSAAHWFGTDELGRDILSRILFGAHLTLGAGLAVVLLASLAGVPLGLASAYAGGWIDNLIMRVMDVILAFPSILLAMAIMAALGFNLQNAVLAVALVYVPKFARVVRAAALGEKSLDYVRAAQALGCRPWRVMFVHLLPNCIAPIIVLATLSLATAILEAAALSFLGLGAQPPMSEWGRMLSDGRGMFQTHPHVMIFPGLAIAFSVMAINLFGDGLRDACDVRLARE
jgi:peptide/nickel transport system permease protein